MIASDKLLNAAGRFIELSHPPFVIIVPEKFLLILFSFTDFGRKVKFIGRFSHYSISNRLKLVLKEPAGASLVAHFVPVFPLANDAFTDDVDLGILRQSE